MNLRWRKIFLLVFIVLFCCVSFIACSNNSNTDNPANVTQSGTQDTISTNAPQNVSGTENSIKWEAVSNAVAYGVFIDGKEYSASGTSFDVEALRLPNGQYEVFVRAYFDNDKQNKADSATITIIIGKTYKLQILSQEGGTTNISSKSYPANSVVSLIAYPKDSYHFDGWYSDSYYKVGSDRTFSFMITEDTILFAFFTKDIEETTKEASDDSNIMQCDSDFSVVVYCSMESNDEKEIEAYIKNNFFIYDDFFLDDNGNVVQIDKEKDDYFLDKNGKIVKIQKDDDNANDDIDINNFNSELLNRATREIGQISNKGNNLFVISPKQSYEKSGSYVAKATGKVSILKEYSRFMNDYGSLNGASNAASEGENGTWLVEEDQGIDSLSFSVKNNIHEDISFNDNVLIYSYADNKNANSSNVDGWILERIGTGLTDETAGIIGGFVTTSIDSIYGGKVTAKTDEDEISQEIIGKIIGFGGGITKDVHVDQFDENTIFGRIKSWQYCGDEKQYCPIFFIELESVESDSDVFETLDVYSEGDIDISEYVEENAEEIKNSALNAFCASEDWLDFLVSVEVASNEYAKENGYDNPGPLNAANIDFNNPKVTVNGTEVVIALDGKVEITFAEKESSFGKQGGKLTISFSFKETLKLEYTFSWVKKEVKVLFVRFKITNGISLSAAVIQNSKFTFDIAFEFSAGTNKKDAQQFKLNETTRKFHVPTCPHVQTGTYTNKNKSVLEMEKDGWIPCLDCIHTDYVLDEEHLVVHKPGCWHLKSVSTNYKIGTNMSLKTLDDLGYTVCETCGGIQQKKYYLDNSDNSYKIHVAGCKHLAAMTKSVAEPTDRKLADLIDDGYAPCGTCLSDFQKIIEQEAEEEKFTSKLMGALNYLDWGDQLKEIKDRIKSATNPDTSKEFTLCEIPFNYVVTFWVKLYLNISFKVEATLHYEVETNDKFTIRLSATLDSGFHASYAKTESAKSTDFTLAGKVEAKIGIRLELGISDPLNLVYVGITGTIGMYADLSGIVHYGSKENSSTDLLTGEGTSSYKEEFYAAAYLEVGFYYDFGISYRVLAMKGSLSLSKLFGLSGKVPLLEMGFNKVVYGYQNDITEALLLASEAKNEFTLEELNLMNVKTLSLPSMSSKNETLKLSAKEYNTIVTFVSESGYLSWDKQNCKIVVSKNAPFGQTFEDTVTIVVKSADSSFRLWTWDEIRAKKTRTISYLPTITVKLICANQCEEHSLLYLATEDPTCTETGLEECKMCMRCGKFFAVNGGNELAERKVIAALGHDFTPMSRVEPQCMVSGLTEGTICKRCEFISVPQENIDPLGHEACGEWIVEKEPTCEGQGRKYQGCVRCELPMNYTPILPHGHYAGEQKPSCQSAIYCLNQDCAKELVGPTGHQYEKVEGESYDATCTTAGRLVKQCAYCPETTTEELPALGHSGWESATERALIKAAECEEEGIYIYTCTRCGESIDGNDDPSGRKPALGHYFSDEFTLDYAAGCVTEGKESRHCARCDEVAESHIIPSFGGHDWGEWIVTDEAKCEETGSKYRECDRCGERETVTIPVLTHNWSEEWTIDVEATCTVNGQKSHHCLREGCTATKDSNPIIAPGHQWGDTIAYPYDPDDPNHIGCDDVGSGYHICNVCQVREDTACGHIIEGYSCNSPCTRCGVVTTAHKKGTPFKVVAATCTEDGEEWAQCTVCKDIVYTILEALGHSTVYYEATNVSCTIDGRIQYWHCTACEKYFSDESLSTEITQEDTVIPAPGHHCVLSGTNYATTCDADGTETYTCDRVNYEYTYNGKTYTFNCDHTEGYTYTVTIPKHDHVWVKNDAKSKIPTCTEDGWDFYECQCVHEHCGCAETKSEAQLKTGHTPSGWITTTEPTCTGKGSKHKICTVCNAEVDTQEIPAHGLTHVGARPAGCFTDGNKEYWYCDTCNKYYKDDGATEETTLSERTIPGYTQHQYDEWDEINNCWGGAKGDLLYDGNGSVCTDYYYIHTCQRCQDHPTKIIYNSHAFDANMNCTQCLASAEGLSYTLTDETYYTVTGYTGTSQYVFIPDNYNNKPVQAIGDNAFANKSNIKCVYISKSITAIGSSIFSGCTALESITIPFVGDRAGVTSTDTFQYPLGYLFGSENTIFSMNNTTTLQPYYASSLSTTTNTYWRIPSSLKYVTVSGGYIPYGAFYYCDNIVKVTLQEGVTSIGSNAFNACYNLVSITIPNSTTKIENNAFSSCYKLIEIYNRSSLDLSIGSSENGSIARNAKNIYNTTNNSKLSISSTGYVVYDDFGYSILMGYVGMNNDLEVPENISEIYQYAFYKNESLKKITIPNSTESIGDYSFYRCYSLENVIMGNAVESIGYKAFAGEYDIIWGRKTNKINSIELPESIQNISLYAFFCNTISEIIISNTNAFYCVEDGVLFNKNKTVIICYPAQKADENYVIPSSVIDIQDAFCGAINLKNITIPEKVTYISYYTFKGCSKLGNVIFLNENEWYSIESYPYSKTILDVTDSSNNASTLRNLGLLTHWEHFHQYEECNIIIEPSCTHSGEAQKICVCGDEIVEIIDATEHNWEIEVLQYPTCTQSGLEHYHCSVCGATDGKMVAMVSPALGHNYVNGKCSRCGQTEGGGIAY